MDSSVVKQIDTNELFLVSEWRKGFKRSTDYLYLYSSVVVCFDLLDPKFLMRAGRLKKGAGQRLAYPPPPFVSNDQSLTVPYNRAFSWQQWWLLPRCAPCVATSCAPCSSCSPPSSRSGLATFSHQWATAAGAQKLPVQKMLMHQRAWFSVKHQNIPFLEVFIVGEWCFERRQTQVQAGGQWWWWAVIRSQMGGGQASRLIFNHPPKLIDAGTIDKIQIKGSEIY